jgi:hypothetical protein
MKCDKGRLNDSTTYWGLLGALVVQLRGLEQQAAEAHRRRAEQVRRAVSAMRPADIAPISAYRPADIGRVRY